MDFQAYIESKRNKKPNQEIVERWQTRVVARGLDKQGERGAEQYLSDYGKGIAAPKCILLAVQAENAGCGEVAMGFWKKAYELETGQKAVGGVASTKAATPFLAPETTEYWIPAFPLDKQPGKLVTMQPVDGKMDRRFYITSDRYWGQPKRDGNKVVVFATADQVWYQSRSLKLRGSPSARMDTVLMTMAQSFCPFILEGELYYKDVEGKEHRTGAQAASRNIELTCSQVNPVMVYAIFSCLYLASQPNMHTQMERVLAGYQVGNLLAKMQPGMFEVLPTARTTQEKTELAARQKTEGREGEVWFDATLPYRPGKYTDDKYVRTKYLTELEVKVTNLTPTTAQGRPFGAIEIATMDDKPLGQIGTGFTMDEAREIAERFRQGNLRIQIQTQGFTEAGNVFLGRFVDFA